MVAKHIEKTEKKYGKKTKVMAWDEYFKEVSSYLINYVNPKQNDDDATGVDEYNYDDEFTPQYYKHYLESFQLSVKKNQFDVIVIDAVNAKTHEYSRFMTLLPRFELNIKSINYS